MCRLRLLTLAVLGMLALGSATAVVHATAYGYDEVTLSHTAARAVITFDGLAARITPSASEFLSTQEAASGTSTTPSARSVATEAEGPALESAFHHTTSGAVDSIMETGLRPGAYATPTEGLSPLQAHIELALNPAGGARNALLQIDLAGLRAAGYEIPGITRVTGAFGMAGGGYEMQFPYAVPSEFLKVIWP